MNEKQLEALRAIGGDGFVEFVTRVGEEHTKDLEEADVDYKSESEKAGYAGQIRELAEKITDGVKKKRVTDFCDKLEEAYPDAKAKKEEGEGDELKPESADEKASKMEKFGAELRLIAGQVGGDVGKSLRGIADKMLGESGEKEAEPITREEIADVLTAIVGTVREEITESSKATTEALTEALKPLFEEVKALKATDAEKVAGVAAETPAASLSSLLKSVIGQRATAVDDKSDLLKGPKETQPGAKNLTGVELIDLFASEADQKIGGQ